MRAVLLATLLLPACSLNDEGNNTSAQAPAPRPTGTAPKTPVTKITPEPGKARSWMDAQDDPAAPRTAPYGNTLDQPVVNAAGR